MKKYLLAAVLAVIAGVCHAQLNVTFRSNLPYPAGAYLANIGGYVDSLGNEYALVGYEYGLSIVDVTDPANPVQKFTVAGPTSDWREVKTWKNYAYVTTEGGSGLQIINLGYLPDSVTHKLYTGDGAIAGQLDNIHSLHIDSGYVFLNGSNLFGGNAIIADLADPWNPVYKGYTPGDYVHDCYVRNDTLWAAHIYQGYFSAIDIHNKSNPIEVGSQPTPSLATHNMWLNDAGSVLFTTDETNDSYLTSYDVTDVTNMQELDRIQLTPGSGSIIHNTHTLNDYEIISWYKDGIAIVDVARPDNMVVVGFYDTFPQGSGGGYDGCWGVYPFLPSGNLLCSDISNGLFVLTPTYIRGCYLEGNVTDSITGIAIPNVTVKILGPDISKQGALSGTYKTGCATAGVYDVQFSKSGYLTRIVQAVVLQNGTLTLLDTKLFKLTPFNVTGNVSDLSTGLPIANAQVAFTGTTYSYTGASDVNGNFTITGFYQDTYTLAIGKWGYVGYCATNTVVSNVNSNFNVTLSKGYYDDFSVDLGWVQTAQNSQNLWERAIPIPTYDGTALANPDADASGDCDGNCWVTDNGLGDEWANDVDRGPVTLNSPIFNLSTYTNPVINYSRWFYNGGFLNGPPNDTMTISIFNGTTSVELETLTPTSAGNGTWMDKSFVVSNYLTPTSTMRITIKTTDTSPGNIVEGAFDKFAVTEAVGLDEISASAMEMNVTPNPFSNTLKIYYNLKSSDSGILTISDITGRIIQQNEINNSGVIETGSSWMEGIYLAHIQTSGGTFKTIRLVKSK